ncbi:unnamed protein product [Dicrocoelium dendriticum]|nr:unnamed protein product [Dicrocoelium dendriticum]
MHLKQGDPKPAIDPSRFTLIGHRFCPYVERVRLTLHYHHIDFDSIFIALNSKPDWFLDMYPTGKVPLLLTTDGKSLVESDVIMRYVDQLRGPAASLMSICGEEQFSEALDLCSKLGAPSYRIAFGRAVDSDEHDYRQALHALNDRIKGPYFMGPELSLADLVLLPHLNRVETTLAFAAGLEPSKVTDFERDDARLADYPKLLAYILNLRQQSFVSEVREPSQVLAKFGATIRAGNPNPDL